MNRPTNIIVQIASIAVQGFNMWGGFIPPKYQLAVGTVIGAVQAVASLVAHNYNPDGTPATIPYDPPRYK